ncbi:autotransporter domain-containing protein [Allopusillimonas ginsengisoli]|nr:autotransporter domain-containing protein [Allopusillimonas ginsengisoli]
MGTHHKTVTVLRVTTLSTALLMAFGSAPIHAEDLKLKDGQETTLTSGEYGLVDVRASSSKDLTTLNASNFEVNNDMDSGGNFGAVFAKAGSINISDSVINSTGVRGGLQSYNSSSMDPATSIVANRVQITTAGKSAHGAFLYFERNAGDRSDSNLTINDSTIHTTGDIANGLIVGALIDPNVTGSGVLLANNVTINTEGAGSAGVKAQFNGNTVVTQSNIKTSGAGANGLFADTGGKINFQGGSVTTTGKTAHGAFTTGAGSSITAKNVVISVAGVAPDTANGMAMGLNASDSSTISLDGGSVSTLGAFSRAVYAAGASTVSTNGVTISTAGADSHAVQASGTDSAITITGGTIQTKADRSWGFNVNGAKVVNSATVLTEGQNSFGAFVEGTGGQFTQNKGSITTKGGKGKDGSYGVLAKDGGVATLTDTSVTTSGQSADGLRAESSTGKVTASNTKISTSGANAYGINAVGGGNIAVTGGSITTTGTGAAAVRVQDNGTVALTGVNVKSSDASIISQLTQAGQTQNITAGSGTTLTQNNGTLLQVNRATAAMDGIVNLTLAKGSTATGDVVDLDGLTKGGSNTRAKGGKTNFVVGAGASWTGIVKGINDAAVADGGSLTNTGGAPISGNVTGGSNATVTFTNGADISGGISTGSGTTGTFAGTTSVGGSVVGTGSTLAFNGPTTIGQNLSTQGSTVTFGNTASITQNLDTGSGANVGFGGTTSIGQSLVGGSGSTVSFSGTTTIAQDVLGADTTLNFSQSAPTTIGGDVDLTGQSELRGGTTGTPIAVQGNASVSNGATLGGNLFVDGALSGSGGSLSPGNSVGTQSYGTSSGFTGTLNMEVNGAGKSDLIIIRNGDFNLTGVNLVVGQEKVNGVANGGYVLNHDYTIVQTVNGDVLNTFDSEELDSSFAKTLVKFDPVKYGAKDVKISLSADNSKIDAARAGLSSNQNATLDGVLSVAGRNSSADAALQSTDTKGSLNQLSGEVHASTQTALMNSSGVVARTLSNRMRSNLGAGMVAGAPTAQAYGATAGSMPRSAAYPLWAEVVGNWSSLDGNNNTAKTKTDIGGLFIGGDAAVGSSGWRLGGALGFTDGKIKTDDRNSRSDVTSYTAALYGGNSWETAKGKVNFLAGAAYTRHDVDSRRSVTVGGNQTLKASYDVNTTQLFTELGYALPVGAASTIEPYVGLAWLSQDAKSFKESGGSAALSGKSQKDDITTFTLGLRGKTTVDVGANQANLMAGLGWRHAAGDVDATRTMSFIQGNGAGFKIAGAPIAKNAAVLDLAAEMGVGRNAAMGLSYAGQFGDGNTDSAGTLYLKVKF